jgi:hypothetical protein
MSTNSKKSVKSILALVAIIAVVVSTAACVPEGPEEQRLRIVTEPGGVNYEYMIVRAVAVEGIVRKALVEGVEKDKEPSGAYFLVDNPQDLQVGEKANMIQVAVVLPTNKSRWTMNGHGPGRLSYYIRRR